MKIKSFKLGFKNLFPGRFPLRLAALVPAPSSTRCESRVLREAILGFV